MPVAGQASPRPSYERPARGPHGRHDSTDPETAAVERTPGGSGTGHPARVATPNGGVPVEPWPPERVIRCQGRRLEPFDALARVMQCLIKPSREGA